MFVLQLVLNDFLIEIQKCEFGQLAFKSSVKSFVQAALGDSAAAEAGDDAADVEVGEFTSRTNHVVSDDTADTDLERTVNHNRGLSAFKGGKKLRQQGKDDRT